MQNKTLNLQLDTRHFGGPRRSRKSAVAGVCETLAIGLKHERKDWSWDKGVRPKRLMLLDTTKPERAVDPLIYDLI
jgi:hypothetical protein